MNTQTIYYSSAACGAGKTKWAVERIGRTPGRYIYAVDRTEEFAVRQSLIINNAIQSGAAVRVCSLSSEAGNVVSRDFPLMIERCSDEEHVVLIMTHEAVKRVDHSAVEGRRRHMRSRRRASRLRLTLVHQTGATTLSQRMQPRPQPRPSR